MSVLEGVGLTDEKVVVTYTTEMHCSVESDARLEELMSFTDTIPLADDVALSGTSSTGELDAAIGLLSRS